MNLSLNIHEFLGSGNFAMKNDRHFFRKVFFFDDISGTVAESWEMAKHFTFQLPGHAAYEGQECVSEHKEQKCSPFLSNHQSQSADLK